jgi:hypothetical protein
MILPIIVFILCLIHFIKTLDTNISPADYSCIHGLISGALVVISALLSIQWGLP